MCSLSSTEGDITIYVPETLGADIEIQIPLADDPNREARIESDIKFSQFQQRCLQKEILILSTQINGGGGKIQDLYR